MAMLLRSLRDRVIGRGARNFRAYADLALSHEERAWCSNGTRNRVLRMPAGPTAVITPWNAPFMLATWKMRTALCRRQHGRAQAGGVVAALGSLLADLADGGGLPPGVFNVVQGTGEEVGAALVADPRCGGSRSPARRRPARLIGCRGRRATSCRSPPSSAARGVHRLRRRRPRRGRAAGRPASTTTPVRSAWPGRGCSSRHRSRDDVPRAIPASRDAHVLGDPRPDATTISPMIHPDHLARVEGFVGARARRRRRDRARRPPMRARRLWYEPTLIDTASNDSEVVQHEVFGPVLTLQTFADEAEAVALANSTAYGLSAIVHTGSPSRAERVGRALRAGTVWVNCFLVRDLTAPFGGMRDQRDRPRGRRLRARLLLDLKTLQVREEART